MIGTFTEVALISLPPEHSWGLGKFYKEILHKSDCYIRYLERSRLLVIHLQEILSSLNRKLEQAGYLPMPPFKLLPKRFKNESTLLQKVQFQKPVSQN